MDNAFDMKAFWEAMSKRERAEKVLKFKQLNQVAQKGQIVLLGSSLMDHFPVNELLQQFSIDKHVYNRGISGDTTHGLLANLDACVLELAPSKVFINIGSNDIGNPDYNENDLMSRYEEILLQIKKHLPNTQIFLLAYYPVNPYKPGLPDTDRAFMFATRTNDSIRSANLRLIEIASRLNLTYIDLFTPLLDNDGLLQEALTLEGIHLWPNAYKIVLDILLPYFKI